VTGGPSAAYKLAAIDWQVRAHCGTRIAIRTGLSGLGDQECRESKLRISDMAVVATQLLAKKQIRMSTLQVLRGVNQSIPRSLGRTKCADIFAAFVILVEANH
jgi:hypothetical protein